MPTCDEAAKAKFDSALAKYQRKKKVLGRISSESKREEAIARLDRSLDEFLESPSPCFADFHRKLEILELEYGLDAQPRHLAAIYSDVGGMAALSGCNSASA